ncbi:MAG: hypothetical protein AVDCRST_MAG07-2100 [uncultured Frankineae bacterium]|uniref:Uncharacterized protein n=1 Tax=uncultured Frankineae bacterium TaxID=437475 RepID=A0A6J4LAX6_9ACTN|nr:MAG: hypothetical protein AVDCRST_MAG07-2100 [uncultured Frankineae bacterium]
MTLRASRQSGPTSVPAGRWVPRPGCVRAPDYPGGTAARA